MRTETMPKQQLISECIECGISLSSKKEYVRYIDKRSGEVIIETLEDFHRYNGGSNKANSELDLFVPGLFL